MFLQSFRVCCRSNCNVHFWVSKPVQWVELDWRSFISQVSRTLPADLAYEMLLTVQMNLTLVHACFLAMS